MVPLLLFAVALSIHDQATHWETRRLELKATAQRLVGDIDSDLAARIKGLQMMAQSTSAQTSNHMDLYAEAQAYQQSFGGNGMLADAERRMLFTTREPLGTALPSLPHPLGRSAAETVLASGQAAVSDLFIGPVSRQPMVAVAFPMVRDGQAPLLLIAAIEARELQAAMARAGLPAGWSASLRDGSARVIAGE